LVFAGNFCGPVAAIDLYCDRYDYPWLGEIQQRICQAYPQTRPHWGKSFITAAFRRSIGEAHIDRLRDIHNKYYPRRTLRLAYEIELFLGI
jgi:hypothetical protein